jgi:hypothetical protein
MREEPSGAPNVPGRAQGEQQLHAWPNAWDRGGERVVDVERPEHVEARAAATVNQVRDELAGAEDSHGA